LVLLRDTLKDQKVDIWATSGIFGELLSGQVLFATNQKVPENNSRAFDPSQIVDVPGPITNGDCAREYKFKMCILDDRTRPAELD
jgi:hypothetical protein